MARRTVDLPDPLSPTRPKAPPGGTWKLTPWTMAAWPMRMCRSSAWITYSAQAGSRTSVGKVAWGCVSDGMHRSRPCV